MYIYIYIYIHTHTYIYKYIFKKNIVIQSFKPPKNHVVRCCFFIIISVIENSNQVIPC